MCFPQTDTEGFEDQVLAGAMDVLAGGLVDHILVEVKEFNTIQKRQLLRLVFRAGGFKYIYGYREQYSSRLESVSPSLDGMMTDLTEVIVGDPSAVHKHELTQQDIVGHGCEDHFFTKHPLPSSMLAARGSSHSCL